MSARLSQEVRVHLDKARESAILAVEIYNKPATTFRSGGFVVLMCIAWTALFHAVFFNRHVKPFYRQLKHKRRYLMIDGDYKAWELKECLAEYFGTNQPPERINVTFFIGLRNKIEHRSMPELDIRIFGECQAFLLNFEELMFQEFGTKYAINESLALALQFSHLRDRQQEHAIAKLHRPLAKDIDSYIKTFRSSLTIEQLYDLRFSYKVFLFPKVANHRGQEELAVEFVKFDPSKVESEYYKHLVSLIKPTVTQVANQGMLKPSMVAAAVLPVVKDVLGDDAKFDAASHHARACYYYKIRPRRGEGDPMKTDVRYCQYDEPNKSYLYTEAWVTFLKEELKKPGQYERIFKKGSS